MRTSETIQLTVAPEFVFPHVARLDRYPAWLRLVHEASEATDQNEPNGANEANGAHEVGDLADLAWDVELRARVGPFARSKRLRMARIEIVADRLAVFERAETDGRDHARWALRAELAPAGTGTLLTMHLAYDGGLWTGGILERVLDDEIRRGREALAAIVAPHG